MAFNLAAFSYIMALIIDSFLIIFVIFHIIGFDELQSGQKNPIDQCNTLNPLVLPEYALHIFINLLFLISEQWFILCLHIPLIAYHIWRYSNRPIMTEPGLYDPTSILNAHDLAMYQREGWVKMAFYLLSFFYYLYGLLYLEQIIAIMLLNYIYLFQYDKFTHSIRSLRIVLRVNFYLSLTMVLVNVHIMLRLFLISICPCCKEDRYDHDHFSLVLSFEYLIATNQLQWITITSDQAILMSVCLQSMIDELLQKSTDVKKHQEHQKKSWTYIMRDGHSRIIMGPKQIENIDEEKEQDEIRSTANSEPLIKRLTDRSDIYRPGNCHTFCRKNGGKLKTDIFN